MKKTAIAFAALLATGAFAQSNVTLFGVIDARLAFGSGSVSDRTQLSNSGYNSSRLGFRGSEDLGGGLKASFHLETGMANDSGAGAATNTNNQASGGAPAGMAGGQGLTFNRRSTVSLAGGWGEVRLGRDYSTHYYNLNVFDPFGAVGVGQNQALDATVAGQTRTRVSNAISYFGPGCSSSSGCPGLYGQAQVYLGENASNAATADDGTGASVRLGWQGGPFNVAVSTGESRYAAGDTRSTNLGASFSFAAAKLMAVYGIDKVSGGATGKGYLVGATAPLGAGVVRASVSSYKINTGASPKSTKLALGYVHNLSKRTALYATYARAKNSGGARAALNGAVTAANASSSGVDLGIRHSF